MMLVRILVSLLLCCRPAHAGGKAFPTAEGFGQETVGGRGGQICVVTTLNDSGPGSLRDCLTRSGPRIVTFAVSGTITLQSVLQVSSPYVTIAGQTSPGGIQIQGNQSAAPAQWGVWFVSGAHDIIIRHLRFRFGGGNADDAGANLLFYSITDAALYHIVVDHCEFEWGSDSQLELYGTGNHHVSFQWTIIAEGAQDVQGGGSKGDHVGGFGTPSSSVSIHHSLYASNAQRNPLVQHAQLVDFRHNVIYNWGGNNVPPAWASLRATVQQETRTLRHEGCTRPRASFVLFPLPTYFGTLVLFWLERGLHGLRRPDCHARTPAL